MAKKKKNSFAKIIFIVALVLIFSFLAMKNLNSDASITVENRCKDLKFDSDIMEPKIINQGSVSAYVKTCFSSDFFIFDNGNNVYCKKEEKILAFNNSIKQEFALKIDPAKPDVNKASISVEISCKKRFLFFTKDCSSLKYSCNFDKTNLLGLPA
ncbi:MAG TPA: hypothetical protein VJB94_03225 [Candidatus Nanoarchaeia archaeon]|nr:hypothetical protein [Candidatus Nanoarchaeia archaeon]